MLGWLISLVNLVWSAFNMVVGLVRLIPETINTFLEMYDFVSDTATIYFSNFPVPILTIGYIFLSVVIAKIVIEVI